MKYMLLMTYGETANCDIPITEWPPEDVNAHMQFQNDFGAELRASGELVDGQGLAFPDQAKIVTQTVGAPVVTDGPFPESKEFLAGYWMIEVESEARALEIAAKASAAPGPKGEPLGVPIEVREVMSVPASDV